MKTIKNRTIYFSTLMGILTSGLTTSAIAQPGSGIRLGNQTILVPKLTGAANYDDNVNLRRRALSDEGGEILEENESDTFLSYSAMLSLTRLVGNRRLTASAWYGESTYDEYSQLNGENYGARGEYFWTRPGGRTTFGASGGYEHAVDRSGGESADFGSNTDQEIENVSERVERDIAKASVTINQELTSDLGSSFVLGYEDVAYVEEDFNDRTSYDYVLELNHQFSEKTQPYARLGLGIDDDEGFEGNAEKPFYLLGVRYTATDKLRIDVAIGYQTYSRTRIDRDPLDEIDNNDIEDSGLKYTLNIAYQATVKSSFRINGKNGYDSVASSSSTSRRENNVSLSYRHQTTRRINQSLLVSWRKDDYLTPITVGDGEIDELKETVRYQYSFNYQTGKPWLNLFAKVSYEDGSSKFPGDSYDQTEVAVGVTARY